MARLMRYMINYQGNKIFSTLSIKLSKPIIYNLNPPILERVDVGKISECSIKVTNTFSDGVRYLYTDDGSDPTKDSAELTSGMRITKNCTIKVIAMVEDANSISMSASAGVLVIDDLRNEMPIFRISDRSF